MKTLALLAVAVLLAGCGKSEEVARLEIIDAQLTHERDADVAMAEQLKTYRADLAKVDAQLEKAKAVLPETNAAIVMVAAEKASGTHVGYEKTSEGPILTVSGTGGPIGAMSALDRLAAAEPGLVMRRGMIGTNDWSATMLVRGETPAPEKAADAHSGLDLPGPGLFSGAEATQLRARIARTEREIEELKHLIGDVVTLHEKQAHLQRLLAQIDAEPDRMKNGMAKLDILLGAKSPVFSTCVVNFEPQLHVSGPLAPGMTLTTLPDIIHGKFEIVKIASGNAELRGLN